MNYSKRLLLVGCMIAASMTGCKIGAPGALSSKIPIPESYGEEDSLASVATIKWTDFFQDTRLRSLIEEGLQNNPDMIIALQRVRMAEAGRFIAKRALFPNLDLDLAGGLRRFGDYTIDGVGNYDTNFSEYVDGDRLIPNPVPDYFAGLKTAWEIDLWGKLRKRKRAAAARLLASESGTRLVKTSLIAEIASLYYELLAYDNELEIIRENIRLQENGLEVVVLQKEAGRATELAVKQFAAQLQNTRSLGARVKQQIVYTENLLNRLLGRLPQPIERGESIDRQELPGQIATGFPSELLLNRPDIRQAEFNLIAAKEDIAAARAAFYPSLSISANAGLNAFRTGVFFDAPASLAYHVVGGLTTPLLNRYELKSAYKQRIAEGHTELAQYEKTVLSAFEEVYTSIEAIKNYAESYEYKKAEVDELAGAISISNDLFTAGYASYLEVIMAQRNVLQANMELTNTRKDQFVEIINLYRALGGGWQ